jgi:hypothetical protein
MEGEGQAIRKCPPRAPASGDMSQSTRIALVAATSTAATQIFTPPANALNASAGYFLTMIASVDTFVRFGVGDPGAAVVTDYFALPAAQERDYWITGETHFRAISASAGTLDYYRSSR